MDFFGPLVVTTTTVTTFHVDAVAEYDLRSGKLLRLLAPRRSDSAWFAARGTTAVTPRCDGVLVVHRDGCQVGELVGHTVPGGRPGQSFCGLELISDTVLVSLGADATLRRWDVATATLLNSTRIDGGAEAALGWHAGSSRLVISAPDTVSFVDPTSLAVLAKHGPFATTIGGWRAVTDGVFVGVSADPQRTGLLVRTGKSTVDEFIDTHDAPKTVAIAAQGAVAAIVGPRLVVRTAAGEVRRTTLATPLYEVAQAAFSPDGSVIIAQDAQRGLRAIDVQSGRDVVEFERRV